MAKGSDTRVTYRRRHSYNTRSNKIQKAHTPGGKIGVKYVTKKAKGVRCGDCKKALPGIPRLRPTGYALIPKHDRTVNRAYGGSRCATCTRTRILRAFIVEEHKIVRALLASAAAAAKKA
jgi:large subunit ribosomal protein L34e